METLNLYRLSHIAAVGYDAVDAFVVCAADEASARALPQEHSECGDECRHYGDAARVCAWRDPEKSTCEVIGTAVVGVSEGVIVRSYNAG